MSRRLASVVAALLLVGCSVPFIGDPAPEYGFITITDGGQPLVGGAADVPPTLDLRMHAAADFRKQDVTAQLDGRALPVAVQAGDVLARTAPMPLGSAHHLAVSISGRADGITINFNVIGPTQAALAAHIDAGGLVVDAAFDDAPSQPGVAAALPGSTVTWVDAMHARITWPGGPPASLSLPAALPTARGSHLAAQVSLDLSNVPAHALRRVTVPAAPGASGVNLVAFVVDTSAGNTSLARHQGTLNWVVATGWQAQSDGSILGTPDPPAVLRANAAHLPVWPSLANDSNNPDGTSTLLRSQRAVAALVSTVVTSVQDGGFAGVNVDFEGMHAADRSAFTGFVKTLADALHAKGSQLMVDVVPHDTAGINGFSAAYDVAAIGGLADFVDLMAYDQHGDGGSPGPVAGLNWDQSVLAATLPGLNPAHTLLGIPLYARRWQGGGGAAAGYVDALRQALSAPGARVSYDFAAQTPFILSPDTSDITYFDDADSLARKIAVGKAHGLAGVAAWRLGFEDPAFWSLFG